MTIDDIKKEYGTMYRFFKEVGLSEGNSGYWAKVGFIPIVTQLRIERLTKGRLKASLNDCGKEE